MARYLDPKNGLTFKRIFGEHPVLLIHFLNAVMPFAPDRQIVEIEYLPAELQENEYIRQAAELCEESAFTPAELAAYEKYRDTIRTDIAVRESIRLKSLKKGEAIGLEKAVLNGARANDSIEAISAFTGLTAGQITEILKRQGIRVESSM